MPLPSRYQQNVRIDSSLDQLRRLHELQAENDRLALEESRRVDVYGALGFEPNCKVRHAARVAGVIEADLPPHCGLCPQERFLGLPDKDEDVLYGGAAGGSKSTSLLIHALRTCVRYPGIQAFWFRRTFPELDHSVLRMLARFDHARSLGAKFDKGSHELRFLNGSILTFAHAKNIVEATALQSAEINILYLDERTTIPPEVVDHLYTRVRSGVEDVPCLGIRSGTNPGDIGHLAVLEGFVEPSDYGRQTFVNDAGRVVRFIQAKATDTPQLDPETYEKRLAGISDPALRAAMRDGSWEVFANQAFGEFRRARHCVDSFTLPDGWRRYGGMDYGWSAPSVYLLAARDGDGRVWVYRELTMTQTPEREQARRILAFEDHRPAIRAADPAMWGRVGSAMPPSSQMAMEGLGLTKADNDRIGGWSRVHQYLAEGPSCPIHREQGWDTCPMLHIVESDCAQLAKTLPTLPRDKNRPEDVDTKAADHWADALRYLLMAIGTAPQLVVFDEWAADREPIVPVEKRHETAGPIALPIGPRFAGLSDPDDLSAAESFFVVDSPLTP